MIIIEAIIKDRIEDGVKTGEFCEPKRQLTPKEKETITSSLSNGLEFIYYQGDEPIVEEQPIIEENL